MLFCLKKSHKKNFNGNIRAISVEGEKSAVQRENRPLLSGYN